MSDILDYYEVLGIPEEAPPEAVKHAYFSLVRRFRPSEFPEIFQQMNEAYQCLSDVRQRQEYDLRRKYGAQVQSFIDQAAAVTDRDPQKALWLLSHARELAPQLPQTRLLLASLQMQLGKYADAEQELRWLTVRFPKDAALRYQLGRCSWLEGRPADAESPLATAILLNPYYHDAMLLLGQVYLALQWLDRAAQTLERAIELDGGENDADLDALILLLAVHALEGDFLKLERSAQRIDAILPDDPTRITGAMARLYARARELARAGNASAAAEILRHAHHPLLSDPDLISAIEEFEERLPLLCEAQMLKKDERILPALREYLIAGCQDVDEEAPHYMVLGRRVELEADAQPAAVLRCIDHLFLDYPGIAEDRRSYLHSLRDRIAAAPAVPPAGIASVREAVAAPSSGEGGFFRRLKRLVGH